MSNHNFQLVEMTPEDIPQFKLDIQEAFQKGFEDYFGPESSTILPEKDIDDSLYIEGAKAYKAIIDNEIIGGAVVQIDNATNINHLDLLYVKRGIQGKGIGKQIWFTIEQLYPNTKEWRTCTPYFDKRNIHFYVNVCGFVITEYFNEHHPMPNTPDDFIGDGSEGMFEFKKTMQ